MNLSLTKTVYENIKPSDYPQTFNDQTVEGLSLIIFPDGKRQWILSLNRWTLNLPLPDNVTLSVAREKALIALSELSSQAPKALMSSIRRAGLTPLENDSDDRDYQVTTLGELLQEYMIAGGSKFIYKRIKCHYQLKMPLSEISILWAEKWREDYIKHGHKIASGNRGVSALRTLLNWGEERGLCEAKLKGIKMLREVDSEVITRFLSEDEDIRLREALKNFDVVFQTLIIVELNTGIRLKALLCLKWEDLDFANNSIALRATNAKSKKTNYTAMNSEAKEYLLKLPQTGEYLFINSRTKTRYKNITKKWKRLLKEAEITNLRFHDLRHNVASQLIKKGVSMSRIAACLTHSDVKITQRYAHLDLTDKLEDLELLVKKD